MLLYSWRRQLNAGVQRLAVRAEAGLASSEEGREGDEDDAPLPLARAVGFADLVSYTSLSRRMNEKTLAQLVQRFENKCAEIISVGGGRLVKTVGDEVLYIAETPAAGAEISLALCQAFTDDEILPQARVATEAAAAQRDGGLPPRRGAPGAEAENDKPACHRTPRGHAGPHNPQAYGKELR